MSKPNEYGVELMISQRPMWMTSGNWRSHSDSPAGNPWVPTPSPANIQGTKILEGRFCPLVPGQNMNSPKSSLVTSGSYAGNWWWEMPKGFFSIDLRMHTQAHTHTLLNLTLHPSNRALASAPFKKARVL